MKESWLEGTDEQMGAEDARHDAARANIESQDDLIKRLLEDWEIGLDGIKDAEDALADARKQFLSDLKAEQKQAEGLEKDVHDALKGPPRRHGRSRGRGARRADGPHR